MPLPATSAPAIDWLPPRSLTTRRTDKGPVLLGRNRFWPVKAGVAPMLVQKEEGLSLEEYSS